MRPEPFIKVFLAIRELVGAVLSYGALLWALVTGAAAALLAVTGRLPELEAFVRSQFLPCMALGAMLEVAGRLIIWLLGYNAMKHRVDGHL